MQQADQADAWEAAGRAIAHLAASGGAIVVTGEDVIAAAHVALGVGREQARRRRVAVADLVGELPPIEALAPGGVRHGVSDSILYGVSLGRIGHAVDPARNLFILPSGDAPLDHDAILRSDRWGRLAASFVEADALLLLVASAAAPGLDALIQAAGRVIVVGATTRPVPGPVLARIPSPLAGGAPAGALRREPGDSLPTVRTLTPVVGLAPPAGGARRIALPWHLPPAAYWTAGAVVAALLLVLAIRQADSPSPRHATLASPAAAAALPRDTAGGTSTAGETAAPPALPPAPDTAIQRYSIQMAAFTSLGGANARLDEEERRGLPAATFSPIVQPDGGRFYYLRVGAYRRWADADSLLRALRRRGILQRRGGVIVKTPYAVLVDRGMVLENAASLARGYRAKGLPVYVVPQGDGTGALYAGAFAAPEQAAFLVATFRANGYQPTVVLRTGR